MKIIFQVDPLSPDAPLIHQLSIQKNPLLIHMNDEELTALVIKLRTKPDEPIKPKRQPKAASTEPKAKKLTLEQRRQAIRDMI